MKNRLFLFLGIVVLISGCAGSSKNKSVVTLVNSSSATVISGSLRACDKTLTISNLESGKEVSLNFTPCSDSDYLVNIVFTSGKKIEKHIGYIAWGANFNDKLVINENDIIFDRGKNSVTAR